MPGSRIRSARENQKDQKTPRSTQLWSWLGRKLLCHRRLGRRVTLARSRREPGPRSLDSRAARQHELHGSAGALRLGSPSTQSGEAGGGGGGGTHRASVGGREEVFFAIAPSRAIQDSRCDLPSAAFTPRDTTLGDILDIPYAHDDRITIWLIMIAGGTTTTTNRLTQM